eukprot:5964197-Alexandrium_andersonii.AAC.1
MLRKWLSADVILWKWSSVEVVLCGCGIAEVAQRKRSLRKWFCTVLSACLTSAGVLECMHPCAARVRAGRGACRQT